MRGTLLLALPLFMACNETSLNAWSGLDDPPNPPDLEVQTRVDRTVQVTVPAVDVLFVVDNSCSMSEEQSALASNFNSFINYFVGSGLDYHVGVVSTGWDDAADRGKLRQGEGVKWIDETVAEPVRIFQKMSIMGTGGPSAEKGRAQVYGAIELLGDHTNAGFYREDAALAVVVISDEDDRSGTAPITLNGFVNWLGALKEDPEQVSFSSIVGPAGGCSTAAEGTDYLEVTRRIGGIEFGICNSDWSGVLEDLGVQAAGLKREFYLSEVPVEGTVEVWVMDADGVEVEIGEWVYTRSRNSIRFVEFVPTPLSEVFIAYEPLAASQNNDDEVGD
jgi:hypothetical protein